MNDWSLKKDVVVEEHINSEEDYQETVILLIESQDNIREFMMFSLESMFNFTIIEARSIKEGMVELQHAKHKIELIISEQPATGESAYKIFRYLVENNLNIPFICTDANRIKDWKPIEGNFIDGMVNKGGVVEELNEIIEDIFVIDPDFEAAEFTGISSKTLKRFDGLSEEMFIQLPTGRFLKIFSRGDKITEDDIIHFGKKDVHRFFIHKAANKWIMGQVDKAMPGVAKNKDANISILGSSPDEDPGPTLSFEENFLSVVHEKTEKTIENVRKNKKLFRYLKNLRLNRKENAYVKNRIKLVSQISCAVAKELDWDSDATLEKLIYVSYMHDISIFKHPTLVKYERLDQIEKLNDSDKRRIENHPQISCDMVRDDKKAPQDAELIILQHHERLNQEGFPNKIHASRIVPFAAVLTVSISMAQYIIEDKKWNISEFAMKYKEEYRGVPFKKVFQALLKVMSV
jgi:response regulator RpfG family c-di-GMP phosphodiesterase